jgi:hypothetical protein
VLERGKVWSDRQIYGALRESRTRPGRRRCPAPASGARRVAVVRGMIEKSLADEVHGRRWSRPPGYRHLLQIEPPETIN